MHTILDERESFRPHYYISVYMSDLTLRLDRPKKAGWRTKITDLLSETMNSFVLGI